MSDRLDPDSLDIDYKSVEKKSGYDIYRGRYKGCPVMVVVNDLLLLFYFFFFE